MAWRPAIPPQGSGSKYDYSGVPVGTQRPENSNAPSINDVFYTAGSGFVRSGLGAYGERILGTGKEYMQSNMSRFFSGQDLQYYFQVNDQYVKNKLKVILCPFLHKGHWTRIAEQVAGGLRFKPPRHDINAPDLYIPFMAFGTYIVLCGYALGLLGKFTPEGMSRTFSMAVMGWSAELLLLWCMLFAMGSGDVPFLDITSYGGYAFVGISICVIAKMVSCYSYYAILPWTSLCMAVFLVKTLKRILFAEVRNYDRDSSRHHYLLLFLAVAQLPLFFWLTYTSS
ncbi:hypothetical protein O6H91_09G033100 [Diphasiastrum complanatum]|uniref:Uncharacterized protein n=3 Tax=Diphasiastrum complanatum TaxID=34168 RepID=A0ACC2CN38_DIPCM|nr:hypothetical protein O6H91_09G032400 [Diphasiastrum complanatum]KAJ7543306.1 hypothetical protein O6H91_09G032400 [Diphasiastrum complanatum]KAJ7543324.1 hypothetical protein O6H91_09G033100 [Diphasiastrum complanatum]